MKQPGYAYIDGWPLGVLDQVLRRISSVYCTRAGRTWASCFVQRRRQSGTNDHGLMTELWTTASMWTDSLPLRAKKDPFRHDVGSWKMAWHAGSPVLTFLMLVWMSMQHVSQTCAPRRNGSCSPRKKTAALSWHRHAQIIIP